MPWGVGLVLSVTVALSLFAAFGSRHAAPLFELATLSPADVWLGQVWRLVTWPFVQPTALGLVFACLFLWWFGRDLAEEWGSVRFLAVFGAVALAAAVGTCLLARVDGAVLDQRYLGGWPVKCAMIVAWGLCFPDRVVRLWFVLPLRGYGIAWMAIAITVFLAVYSGWEGFVPDLVAEGAILAWLFRSSVYARGSGVLRAFERRRREARRRRRDRARTRSMAHLDVIETRDDDPPPLPPELAGKIDDLLAGRGRRGSD
jgi:membrane associated rhomboid family serine protease